MATSPNYAWAEPDNSSLVKNGAADIRTLGDAIDTSVWNVGFGQAGKNKIINGDFSINQRAFTSSTTDGVFTYDRFGCRLTGDGTSTVSAQTFTPGTAPVAGYEATNYLRFVTTGQTSAAVRTVLRQTIEGVRTFAGQTVTLSFWAKAATGTPKIAANLFQSFGSGGSGGVNAPAGSVTISTSWVRYSLTVAIPSISGKTIGTSNGLGVDIAVSAGSTYNTEFSSIGIQTGTFDIWGIQVEYGSKMTPFQTATGTIQGELAACQRYYVRFNTINAYNIFGTGINTSTTASNTQIPLPVQMRTAPSAIDYSTLGVAEGGGSIIAVTSATFAYGSVNEVSLTTNVASGLTQYRPVHLFSNNSTSSYLAFSAEL